VCTKEACQFNDNLAGFQAAGVPVIGVSPHDAGSHQRFRGRYGLRFPLLTDADHAVMDAWRNVKADGHAAAVLSELGS
jgi:peroxiredoxin Q/BCP